MTLRVHPAGNIQIPGQPSSNELRNRVVCDSRKLRVQLQTNHNHIIDHNCIYDTSHVCIWYVSVALIEFLIRCVH